MNTHWLQLRHLILLHTAWICIFLFQAAFRMMQKNAIQTKCFVMSFIRNICTFTLQTATTQFEIVTPGASASITTFLMLTGGWLKRRNVSLSLLSRNIYMCVCVYVYIYIYTHTHTHHPLQWFGISWFLVVLFLLSSSISGKSLSDGLKQLEWTPERSAN